MSWSEAAFWWLPTASVVAITALGFAAVAAQPSRPARKYWMAAMLLCGALAAGATVREQETTRAALGQETARLHELAVRLDEVGRLLPAGPGATPDETFDTVAAALSSLNGKIKDLEEQIHVLQEKTRTRSIDQANAARMAEHLRQFGSRRVVVSCVPDDVEAYAYANQIANMLRDAGWEALGPEKTTIFGEAATMGIRLYVHGGIAAPETAKILLDAFSRFNIPYQSGITPSDAIPDPATVELFVSHKS